MSQRDKRTVRDLRRASRSVLLRHLYFEGPLSRNELAGATGLSAGSITNVVGELIADGIVEEAGPVGSAGGRPRVPLRVAPGYGSLIGIDVGETRVRTALFDFGLSELASVDCPLPDSGHNVSRVVRMVLEGLADVVAQAAVDPASVLGVGIGVPGIVERSADGPVVHGQTIGWDAVPLGRLLREAAPTPAMVGDVLIDNGAKTLGQAELWFGSGRGAHNAVIALLGSGVGACVVTDGKPYRGTLSSAGEWGHTSVSVRGRRCRCGARGCLEAYVGAAALIERWGNAPAGAGEEDAVSALLSAADGGDARAAAVLAETAEYLGAGISDLVNLFNPERIVLSGWTGLLIGPRLLPAVSEAAAAYSLRRPWERTSLELGRLGPGAATIGAAALPLDRLLDAGGIREHQGLGHAAL